MRLHFDERVIETRQRELKLLNEKHSRSQTPRTGSRLEGVAESALAAIFTISGGKLEALVVSRRAALAADGELAVVVGSVLEAALAAVLAGAFSELGALLGLALLALSASGGGGGRGNSAVRVLAFSAKLAAALQVVAADLDAILVELQLRLGLGLLAIATTRATSASGTRASSTATTASTVASVTTSLGVAAALLLRGGLLVAGDVLVLAVLAEAALATVLEVAADLLLARGVLSTGNAVRGALVLSSVQEAAALAETALLLLGPVVAVALGSVVSRRCLDCRARRMLVLAFLVEAAFASVAEGTANLLARTAFSSS